MHDLDRHQLFDLARDAVLEALPDAWAAYVFGSFARGEDWPDSDLDVAVLLPPGCHLLDRLELAGELSRRVHREVDLVDLRQAGMSGGANKIAAIVRCVQRARAEFAAAGPSFKQNFTHQDAAVLNILRGCEAAVDLANMLIRKDRLGIPGEMKDSFALLERAGFTPPQLSRQRSGN